MRIHKLLLAAGFDYNNFFRSVKKKNVERLIAQKLSREEYSGLLDQYDLSRHFAHEVLESEEDRLILKSSILDRIFFLKHCFSRTELDSDSFVDLGDPSGIFLKSLGKPGISFNISEDASRNARTNGMEVVRGTIDSLPFPGNSIDHVFLFQTLEHLHDPIGTLNKIYAVSRKSLTVSVPTVTNTLIHRSSYDPERRPYEHHIFEFSDRDLIKIISHTPIGSKKFAPFCLI
jgi:hypothetical protein